MTFDFESMSMDERRAALLDCMDRTSKIVAQTRYPIRSKPALGGLFGTGGFALCSYHEIRDGLDSVMYFVAHEKTGYCLGLAYTRAEALEFGREVLRVIDTFVLQARMQAHKTWFDSERADRLRQHEDELRRKRDEMRESAHDKVRSIPKRRQRIFEESNGQCHYCGTTLTLDGKWHIEHKMPKALGGGNEPGNLVASCVPCNHKKRDKTDLEFKAELAAKGAAA